jgi:hypothetical protein
MLQEPYDHSGKLEQKWSRRLNNIFVMDEKYVDALLVGSKSDTIASCRRDRLKRTKWKRMFQKRQSILERHPSSQHT